jgi:hypothetical protein
VSVAVGIGRVESIGEREEGRKESIEGRGREVGIRKIEKEGAEREREREKGKNRE